MKWFCRRLKGRYIEGRRGDKVILSCLFVEPTRFRIHANSKAISVVSDEDLTKWVTIHRVSFESLSVVNSNPTEVSDLSMDVVNKEKVAFYHFSKTLADYISVVYNPRRKEIRVRLD